MGKNILSTVFMLTFTLNLTTSVYATTSAVLKTNKIQSIPATSILDAKISPDNPIKENLEKIDLLFHQGSAKNDTKAGIDLLKKSLSICEKLMSKHTEDYEVLFRYARGAYKIAESMKGIQMKGWKDICSEYGKKGMKISEKAQKLEPNRVEAYFWETACIGEYMDGVVGPQRTGLAV